MIFSYNKKHFEGAHTILALYTHFVYGIWPYFMHWFFSSGNGKFYTVQANMTTHPGDVEDKVIAVTFLHYRESGKTK